MTGLTHSALTGLFLAAFSVLGLVSSEAAVTACRHGTSKQRIRCLDKSIADMKAQFSRLERDLSKKTAALKVYSDQIYTKEEIDKKIEGMPKGDATQFVKYGDRAQISVNHEKCLHSGLFAGFEGCAVSEAAGFYIDKPNNSPGTTHLFKP